MDDGDWKAHLTPRNCLLAAGILIVLLGAWLRLVAGGNTVVDKPFRADAEKYYITAFNLVTYGVYSDQLNLKDGQTSAPQPDAFLTPGYPLFVALFADGPPNQQVLTQVVSWQALLSILAVLLTLLLLRPLSPWVALPAAALAAMSPHLVTIETYMLSETLFSVLLLLALSALAWHLREARWRLPALFAGGLLLGLAALTRPVLEFFPLAVVLLLWLSHERPTALRGSAVLLLGFCLAWTPWIARNYVSLGRSGDSGNLVQTMSIGMYPDMEYDHDPKSNGEPGRLDPRYPEISASLGATLKEIGRRFRADPGEELRWYLVGKPLMLWSWHDIGGGPDMFAYPVLRTPYDSSLLFGLTRALMYELHWPLVALALAGCLLVWFPFARQVLSAEALFLVRTLSLLLLYNTAVLMVLAPFARYSIPFLPVLYAMAATAVYVVARGWKRRATAVQ